MLTADFYLIGGLGAFVFLAAAVLIIYTVRKRTEKHLKKPVRTMGFVDKVHPELSTVDYSYTDSSGERRTASFRLTGKKRFRKGDEITVYFDAEAPESCVPEFLMRARKGFLPKLLPILAAVVAGTLLLLAVLDHFGILEKIWRFWYQYRWNRRYD